MASNQAQHALDALLKDVRACRVCEAELPLGPRPVVRAEAAARILVVGQAPGTRVHETGLPWNDPSGDRLRAWLEVDRETFYNAACFAIVPMGYCYPGRGPRGGDLPPRRECAELWLDKILACLPRIELTLLIGSYAQRHYLGDRVKKNLTETVRVWREYAPQYIPTPHPSPRNNLWLRKNGWFEAEVVPYARECVHALL